MSPNLCAHNERPEGNIEDNLETLSQSDATMALAMTDDNLEKAVDTIVAGGLQEWSLQLKGGNVEAGVTALQRFEERTQNAEKTESRNITSRNY